MIHTDPGRADTELEDVAAGLRAHVQEVRELIHDLRPLTLDQLGLGGAVRQHVERFDQDTGIRAAFNMSGDIVLSSFAEVTVYRVVQESLANVQKHAKASRVDVTFQVLENNLEAVVSDNGQGFDARQVASDTAGEGMGILRMRERAELLGGSLSVRSSPEGGCEIVLVIPSTEVGVGAH